MSKANDYEAKTEALILPILDRMQFELVDVEYVKEGGDFSAIFVRKILCITFL